LGAKGGGRGRGRGGVQGETEAGSSLRGGQSGFPRPHGAGEGEAPGAAQIWGGGGWADTKSGETLKKQTCVGNEASRRRDSPASQELSATCRQFCG